MQEQMNSVNASGEFQEVELNCSGRLSYVSRQPAMIPSSRQSLGLMRWKVMRRSAWNDIANWQTRRAEQVYQVSTPCLDDHYFKKEELKWTVGGLCLARIGRPDILWSVNKLARPVTKWTRARDKRLARLVSCINHTSDHGQCFHVGNMWTVHPQIQHAQSCTQHNHISSREHAWLKIRIAHLCVLKIIVIHVSCLIPCPCLLPLLSFH